MAVLLVISLRRTPAAIATAVSAHRSRVPSAPNAARPAASASPVRNVSVPSDSAAPKSSSVPQSICDTSFPSRVNVRLRRSVGRRNSKTGARIAVTSSGNRRAKASRAAGAPATASTPGVTHSPTTTRNTASVFASPTFHGPSRSYSARSTP